MSDLRYKITADTTQATKSMQNFKTTAVSTTKAVTAGALTMSASFKTLTASVVTLAAPLLAVGTAINILSGSIKSLLNFETAMANVSSLGVKNIKQLQKSILSLSVSLKFVPLQDLASGLYEVVSAGVDAANQIQFLTETAKAGVAGVSSTTEAIKLASSVLKSYGLGWQEVTQILDKSFQTVKLGQTTFGELSVAIGRVAPLMSAFKISTDELFGSFATLTGVTGNAKRVSTQLAAIMTSLASPTKELTELIKEQGFASVEQAVQSQGLSGILRILQTATKGSATEMNKYFSSVEAVTALLPLTTSQYDIFIEKTDAMTKSQNATNEAFEKQAVAKGLERFTNAWTTFTTAIAQSKGFSAILDKLFTSSAYFFEQMALLDKTYEGWGRGIFDLLHTEQGVLKGMRQVTEGEIKTTSQILKEYLESEELDRFKKEAKDLDEFINSLQAKTTKATRPLEVKKVKTEFQFDDNLASGGLEKFESEQKRKKDILQLTFDSNLIAEEEYLNQRNALLDNSLEYYKRFLGSQSKEYLTTLAEITKFDEEDTEKERIRKIAAAREIYEAKILFATNTANSLIAIGQIFGKAEKAFALAAIAINSGIAISAAIKAGAGLPFPANLTAISSGVLAVLSGIAQAKAALSGATVNANGISSGGFGNSITFDSISNNSIADNFAERSWERTNKLLQRISDKITILENDSALGSISI